ncbi:serine/threonine-protein phosphatase 6 regulatory ankyrin repeat subunit B-like [Lineus longissimus]|uniref:serine/threonine-protein phosphatase 6 regulatory ankyrin repeat subunit B-like n=1 Tax=Lineus longissimus TaxID=88925 RepID=UPI002B4C5D53
MADSVELMPKTQGCKMLEQAYYFMKELQLSAKTIEGKLAGAIFKQDEDAVKACWEPSMVHYRQKEYGLTYLHLAVMTGNLDILRFLLENGTDPNNTAYTNCKDAKSYSNLSCLHVAALFCHKHVLECLLMRGAYTEHYLQFYSKMRKKYSKLNGMTPFHYAIFGHDLDTLKILAKYKASVGATTVNGYTSLHLAAMLNYDDVFQYLLQDSKNFENAISKDGATLLFVAAANGAHKPLSMLIDRGFDVNVTNQNGISALHAAAASGKAEAVHVLCEAGADVNVTCEKYQVRLRNMEEKDHLHEAIPLHAAIGAKSVTCLKMLLKYGADPNSCCDSECAGQDVSPLHFAVRQQSQCLCEILLEHGAEINARCAEGFTPLMGSIIEGNLEVFKFLLQQKDVDVNLGHVATSFSPLVAIILLLKDDSITNSKDMEMTRLILENPSIDLEQRFVLMHRHDVTVLHLAVHKGNKELTELLVERGASVNTTMSFPHSHTSGVSLMHTVATQGYNHLMDYLHKAGAPLDLHTSTGVTPLLMAVILGFDKLIGFFLDQGADPNGGDGEVTALMVAAEQNDIPVMQKLIRKGCDLNRRNLMTGYTALQLAILSEYLVAAHLLIDHGCNINKCSAAGQTSLALAIRHADTRLVERLLEKGADPNEISSSLRVEDGEQEDGEISTGDTKIMPLHLASLLGKIDMMKVLLKHGAKLDGELENGLTPLHEAIDKGQENAALFLIQKGAKVNHKLKKLQPFEWRNHSEVFPSAVGLPEPDLVIGTLVDFGCHIFSPYFSDAELPNFLSRSKSRKVVKKLLFHGLRSNQNLLPLLLDSDSNTIRMLLQHGVDVSKSKADLYHALGESSDTAILSLFIQSGLDLGFPSDLFTETASGPAIFISAARLGHLDMLKMLVKSGVGVNNQDGKGLTALHWASVRRHLPCVKYLIRLGASVTALGSLNGYDHATPLHAAVMSNDTDVTDAIIVAGADISARCSLGSLSGVTPLMVACYSECYKSMWIICFGYGCDVNKQNSAGETALHIVIQLPMFLKQHFFKDLMLGCPNVDIATKTGLTPLMAAVKHRELDMSFQLISRGVGINAAAKTLEATDGDPGTVGRTALHFAASLGNIKIVKRLTEAGATVDVTESHDGQDGFTPLHCAVLKGHVEIIPILVNAGCKINAQTSDGFTALHMAADNGSMDVAKKLMDLEVNPKLKTKDGKIASNFSLFPTIGRLLLAYEAAWDLKHRRPTLQRKRFSLQQRLSMQKIEAFTPQSFTARGDQDEEGGS